MRLPRIAIVAFLILSSGVLSVVIAQRVGASGTVKRPESGSAGTAPSRHTSAPVKIITKYIPKPVTSTTGRLFVSAEPYAVLLIEPIKVRNGQAQQGTVPAGRRDFIFNDLKPGRYRVASTLPGYHQEETEITIEANNSKSVTLNFRPILYSVTINTNVSTGELKYGMDGQPLTNVVPIRNKTVQ